MASSWQAFSCLEHGLHGAGPHLVVLPSAGMPLPPDGPGGRWELVQVPDPSRSAGAAPAGVLGQRREQPQLTGLGAGEGLLAGVPGIGEHGV